MLTRKGTERVIQKRLDPLWEKVNTLSLSDHGSRIMELERKNEAAMKVIETLLRHLKLVYKHIETEDVIVPAPEPHGYGIYVDGHPGATISWDTTKKRKKGKE